MQRAVVILPFDAEHRILIQLRDQKPEIIYPGCWGYFGGSLEGLESPLECAIRELNEELRYTPEQWLDLGMELMTAPVLKEIYAFGCPLVKPLAELTLGEGQDWGLFPLDQFLAAEQLPDSQARLHFLIPNPVLKRTARRLKQTLANERTAS